ncbi:hypothetical protein [Bacillus sonorensis]|nr:hypothetical protein [Bacillus sonorensis]
MEKRPGNRPTENAGGMKPPKHEQASAKKPLLIQKEPKPKN